MTSREILNKVKAIFAAPAVTPGDVAPADTTVPGTNATGANVVSYAVDGGQPVYVDISDDNMADIDQGDAVYTDQALTIPYPDGSYKVTGTDFGFVVTSGTVASVDDKDGKGPGTPVQDAGTPAPVTANAAPAAPAAPVQLSAETAAAMYAKFATGTPEDRLANLEIMVKALMECNFGYQIRQGQENEAIQTYKQELANTTQTVAQQASQLQAATAKLEKQDKIIEGLFELAEKLVEVPTADPKTLTGNKKEQFERSQAKEKKIESIAAAVGQLRNKNK